MHQGKIPCQFTRPFMIKETKSKNQKRHLPSSDKRCRTFLKTLLIPYQANPHIFSCKIQWINCSSQNSNNLMCTINEENPTKTKQKTLSSSRNSSLATLSLLPKSTFHPSKSTLQGQENNQIQRRRSRKGFPFQNTICTSEMIQTLMVIRTGFTFE